MKIISFNIGLKIDNSAAVAEYLLGSDADIICLQEVVRPLEPSVFPIYRSEKFIREKLKAVYPYYFFAPEWVADKLINKDNVRDQGGMAEQGKFILSKYPIVYGANYFYHKVYEFTRDRTRFHEGDDHGRTLQLCEIDANGNIIQIGNVHGLYSEDKQDTERSKTQNTFILEKLRERIMPTILLGDFNLAPETESMALVDKEYENLIKKFGILETRPDFGKRPGMKYTAVDYIFVSHHLAAKNCMTDLTEISDHYPIIAELDFSQS